LRRVARDDNNHVTALLDDADAQGSKARSPAAFRLRARTRTAQAK